MPKITTNDFITKANNIHCNKYDYSKVEYVNSQTKVCIICPEHGEFWQRPSSHLSGCGCPKCKGVKISLKKKKNANEFIEKSKIIHKNKYDYSNTQYIDSYTKVCIICPIHGEFWQEPRHHLSGCGCKKCFCHEKYTKETWIKKSNEIHQNKYNYSQVEYKNSKEKVCIICTNHGEFWQTPKDHLSGRGCPKCAPNRKSDTFYFIEKAISVHKNKYDYNKVKYITTLENVCIICPEHGEFWQRPDYHLQGQGCPKCNSSHLENEVRNLLNKHNINFEEQKKFDWLGNQSLDFYLPDHNLAIECQGIQHFESIEHFGGAKKLAYIQQNDNKKYNLCCKYSVKLVYYSSLKIDFPYTVITDYETLLNEINNGRGI